METNARFRAEWPTGYKVLRQKLYYLEQLCVPYSRVIELVDGHHRWNAHQGETRLIPDLRLHYKFPEVVNLPETVSSIKRSCLVCQACQAPNWALKGPISMTPIPPRVMFSVYVDVFSMPEETWEGVVYDAFLLCVDRHSGWTVAKTTQKEGLTGRKAANLMLESSWGEMGVPGGNNKRPGVAVCCPVVGNHVFPPGN